MGLNGLNAIVTAIVSEKENIKIKKKIIIKISSIFQNVLCPMQ